MRDAALEFYECRLPCDGRLLIGAQGVDQAVDLRSSQPRTGHCTTQAIFEVLKSARAAQPSPYYPLGKTREVRAPLFEPFGPRGRRSHPLLSQPLVLRFRRPERFEFFTLLHDRIPLGLLPSLQFAQF